MLAHGAGGSSASPMLAALAAALAARDLVALRCDLPFRQARPKGPPRPPDAARDREGLRAAVSALRPLATGPVILGGQSYGGRQASMLVAEDPIADALLLLSYPLHPPGRPRDVRVSHLPRIAIPTVFVHGTADPFGTVDEIRAARALVAARSALLVVAGGRHDLAAGRRGSALERLASEIAAHAASFCLGRGNRPEPDAMIELT